MNHTIHHKSLLHHLTEPVLLASIFAAALIVFMLVIGIRPERTFRFIFPDEKAASEALLAEIFTGPGYFHEPMTGPGAEARKTEPYFINFIAAQEQVGRIVKERHLGKEDEVRLNALLDALIEPPHSRLHGLNRVHLLRLNLALDVQFKQ